MRNKRLLVGIVIAGVIATGLFVTGVVTSMVREVNHNGIRAVPVVYEF